MHFSLRCHLCQTVYPAEALWVCSQCLGPLEVTYDYAAIAPLVSRELIGSRPRNLWRYRELLPIAGEPRTGLHSGFTPLVRAERLAARLGSASRGTTSSPSRARAPARRVRRADARW